MNANDKAGQTPSRSKVDARASGRPRRSGLMWFLRHREASILIAGILLVIYFQFSSSAFLSGANVINLVQYTATTAIIAAGEVFVLVCGELGVVVVQTTSVRAIVLARLFGTRVMGNGGVMTVVAPTAQLGLQF